MIVVKKERIRQPGKGQLHASPDPLIPAKGPSSRIGLAKDDRQVGRISNMSTNWWDLGKMTNTATVFPSHKDPPQQTSQ